MNKGRPIQAHFVFEFDDEFQPGNLDNLTQEEQEHLQDLGLESAQERREEILQQRKHDWLTQKQRECQADIGCAVGILTGHGATLMRLNPTNYRPYNPDLCVTDTELKGLGELTIIAEFDRWIRDKDFQDVLNELATHCSYVVESGDVN